MEKETLNGAALVLEGGGMRGLYTAGVLDRLMDSGLRFGYVIGVSAGASHAFSYLSWQRGRSRRINVDYCERPDYMGLRCLLREGSFFGMDLLFRRIPYELDPFDFGRTRGIRLGSRCVVTNLRTGAAEYRGPRDPADALRVLRASCSLPFASRPVTIDGDPFLDGGSLTQYRFGAFFRAARIALSWFARSRAIFVKGLRSICGWLVFYTGGTPCSSARWRNGTIDITMLLALSKILSVRGAPSLLARSRNRGSIGSSAIPIGSTRCTRADTPTWARSRLA
jgi:hypothetical protein